MRRTEEPDPATLERMLYYLKLTRESEYRIERVLYRQGKIVGGVYVGRGQEAIGVGSAIQLTEGDVALPSHRDFSSFVIRGVPLGQIFANWMARGTGPTRGRENTLHIGDLKLGLIPIISPLGDTLPVACGVALTFKQRRRTNVALVHFGEGTTSRGDVHEAMNLAAVMKLAVVFICNNNAYAYSTPTERQYAVRDLSVRGAAYGMPGVTIDGNDVLAVYSAVGKAIALGRAGGGPSFIECKTFRMTGHSAHDAAEYVPKKLLEQEARKDPILRLEKVMLERQLLTREGIAEMERRIHKEIDEAVAYAEAQPMPEGATAVGGVYCGPDCWWKS
ncbi:MAG TPA: thiamine pyrophosphate-dependent dehydrogenase E1 component subunit alpha [Terriglobia bacterium]|nr:thiamine pyrophosphate-dependent dehydrogenase E1 component subunit alpha [Terriglobia bacterium]